MSLAIKVAYLTNQFPNPVEWYVADEICELRRRGTEVLPCSFESAQTTDLPLEMAGFARESVCLRPLQWGLLLRALWMCVWRFAAIQDLVERISLRGTESPTRRARALVHTWLGAYYALLLSEHDVDHIHVHHGYFSSWIALVAARFLGVSFSMTLHGSDLLLHAAYMDIKLAECRFCFTISEFNRRHILAHYPAVSPDKIILRRMGVTIPPTGSTSPGVKDSTLVLLSIGRLHRVKNHIFLLQACYLLREYGLKFRCLIVGEGSERRKLEFLIGELGIQDVVSLVGHVPHDQIARYYRNADVVVLTSLSEGIPLVLMEAMAHGTIVVAPEITGIPELVVDGKTGFLYKPGSLEDFMWRVLQICDAAHPLESVRRSAREHVRTHFNEKRNLQNFVDFLLLNIRLHDRSYADENLVLQQI